MPPIFNQKRIAMIHFLIPYVIISLVIWIIGWIAYDKYGNNNPMISFIFKWYDGWIGFFWDSKKKWLYIFPVPFFGIIIKPFRHDYF